MSDDNDGYLPLPTGFATATIRHAQEPEQWESCSVIPPIVVSTTFKQPSPNKQQNFTYSRCGNPTRNMLEKVLAKLEAAKYARCFASGLAAATSLMTLFKTEDDIIFTNDLYGGVKRMMNHIIDGWGIKAIFVDTTDLDLLERSITSNTKAIWTESLTNPTLQVMDLRGMAAIAKKHNIHLIVDNTFMTPYLVRPLELGADVVLHSMTKYINGHSDVIMGCIVTNNKDIDNRLQYSQNTMGIVPSPFDCYLANRGLKTLALRMKQHAINSLAVAKFLESHPKIEKVIHPGLESHPQHKLFKTQTAGYSGMVSCYIKGDLEESCQFLRELKIFMLAESLGGYESLVELPAIMTHISVPLEERIALKITDNMIRLSVGLEDVEDLIDDLSQALEKI